MLNKTVKQLAHIGALWCTTAKKSEVAFNGHIEFPSGRRIKVQVVPEPVSHRRRQPP